MSALDLESIELALEHAEQTVYNAHKYIVLIDRLRAQGEDSLEEPEVIKNLSDSIEESIKKLTSIKIMLDNVGK